MGFRCQYGILARSSDSSSSCFIARARRCVLLAFVIATIEGCHCVHLAASLRPLSGYVVILAYINYISALAAWPLSVEHTRAKTPPLRGSLSTARKNRKYKCFQLLQSARVASNHAIYRAFCGCPAKILVKADGFEVSRLQKWSKNDQKPGQILSEKAFFGFWRLQNGAMYALKWPQSIVNTSVFSSSSLQEWPQTTLFTGVFVAARQRSAQKPMVFEVSRLHRSLESPALLVIPCYLSFTPSSLKCVNWHSLNSLVDCFCPRKI